MKLVVSHAALADLQRLRDFLIETNPDAATRAVTAIAVAIGTLDIFPDRGRPSAMAGSRELVVPFGQSAYVIRYAHDLARDELIIVRVWHARESRE